ncbi:YdcH family protein [Mesorhizobium sp. KR9-304]|uniref:YdcH family protein n=1 Tax=Mesorhizobium sp. KR9-304 TaxID=3156614 RepID=UPI0032B515BD
MDQFIKSLRHRRATVQARIEDEQARPAPDHVRLSALKRLKLRFRDQIELIERMNRLGEMKSIPVVRRRTFRPLISGKT